MLLKNKKGNSCLLNFKLKYINLSELLPANEFKFIKKIGKYADKFGINAYLVGGFVRDLFIGKKDIDIDITVEGDGIKFTEFLARKLNSPYKCFDKFRTGKIFLKNKFNNKFNIDITSARSEYYRQPAALPVINFSDLHKDLYRRDFTINAMAIQINKKNFGRFIDFFNGYRDLKDKVIRILHNKSFEDDPTRILRAIRFEQRFGFIIEKNTLISLKKALKQNIFDKVPGERLRDEILLILKEKDAIKIIIRGRKLGIWKKLLPGFKFNNKIKKLYENISLFIKKQVFENIDIDCVFFILFSCFFDLTQTNNMLIRLKLKGEWQKKIINIKKNEKIIYKRLKHFKSNIRRLFVFFKNFSKEELFFIVLIHGKSIYKTVEKYLKVYINIKSNITGEDLKKLGIKQGPIYSEILQKVLIEKVAGKIKTKEQEIEFVKRIIKRR
ncbi:MAG: hypothetical protein N2114_05520 [Candidatus Goldbacteria bacterium]|nr:hypothetical protein [Candidatus Goldiibacteriota bacterium]